MIDPRTWKPEHKIAMACAIGLGFLIGAAIGGGTTSATGGCPNWAYRSPLAYIVKGCYGFIDLVYWLKFVFWPILGGAVGGSLVYIRQLLRT